MTPEQATRTPRKALSRRNQSETIKNHHLARGLSPNAPKARPTSETFGPLKLVRRSSTNRAKRTDREVLAALDLIRREACNGLKARDVFASFTCTRRMAEIRFRTATGKSPLEAIQEIRRAKAEELLKDPTRDRTAIANLCSYSSASALANILMRGRPKT